MAGEQVGAAGHQGDGRVFGLVNKPPIFQFWSAAAGIVLVNKLFFFGWSRERVPPLAGLAG